MEIFSKLDQSTDGFAQELDERTQFGPISNDWRVARSSSQESADRTPIATTDWLTLTPGRCLRVSTGQLSMLPMFCVHPTRHYANPNLLVHGLLVSVAPTHSKIRRDGYRRV